VSVESIGDGTKPVEPGSKTYMDIALSEELKPDQDGDTLYKILGHRRSGKKKYRPQLQIEWTNGHREWVDLKLVQTDFPISTALYVSENGLGAPFKPRWAEGVLKHLEDFYLPDVKLRKKSSYPRSPLILHGVKVPRTVKEALQFDKENGNTLWTDAIKKEMTSQHEMETFILLMEGKLPDGDWQYAPLRMIFTVKSDGRHKARLVIGGHVTDASDYDTYAATIRTDNIRIILFVVVRDYSDMLMGDVMTAYLNALTGEKIWTKCGPEFEDAEGQIAIVNKALYGLKTSAHQWYMHLTDTLRALGFLPSRLDPSMWYRLREEEDGYDYVIHHVDDFLICAKDAKRWLNELEKHYRITGGDVPTHYLGADIHVHCYKSQEEKVDIIEHFLVLTCENYLIKALAQVEKIIGKKLGKNSTPNLSVWHPESYESPLLSDVDKNKYQQLIGIGNWLVTIGRVDIVYAVSTLSRYSAAPTEEHFKDVTRVFTYLNKYRQRGIKVRGGDLELLNIDDKDKMFKREDMLKYYPDALDEWDPKWPQPKGKPVDITIFVDADHAGNKEDRRSITGIIIFVGMTPVRWFSKRQGSIETSTYGAELAALKTAVEEAIAMLHTLRSIGIYVPNPVRILVDNKGAVDSATISGSVLKKRHSSIAYNKARECVAAGLIDIYHTRSGHNVADVFTKPVGKPSFNGLLSTFMYGFTKDDAETQYGTEQEE
jgi:hypothetical protein